MKKILILMARFGGGHESIGKAVKDALEIYAPGKYQIQIEDGFPPVFSASPNHGSFPFLVEQGYKITDNEKITRVIHAAVTMLMGHHLKRLIKKTSPDLIIATHPLLTVEVKSVLNRFKRKILLGLYFADAIHPHRFWFSEKQADVYFAPTQDCYEYALKNDIPKKKLICTGWLARKEFYDRDFETKTYKKNLGFNEDKSLIYLSGGGDGVGDLQELVELFLANKFFRANCQLSVICGTNHKLLIKLQKIQRTTGDHLFSYGFINNVSDFKKAADVVCGKAGPNDIFESVLLGKPFFAHTWYWLHEKDNFNWVKKQEIGYAEMDVEKMVGKIVRMLRSPGLLQEKIENAKIIRAEHFNAPKVLVGKIDELMNK